EQAGICAQKAGCNAVNNRSWRLSRRRGRASRLSSKGRNGTGPSHSLTFCGDEDDAIRASDAIRGSGRDVLEDFDLGDVARVEGDQPAHRALERRPVQDIERLAASDRRATNTTDQDLAAFGELERQESDQGTALPCASRRGRPTRRTTRS